MIIKKNKSTQVSESGVENKVTLTEWNYAVPSWLHNEPKLCFSGV